MGSTVTIGIRDKGAIELIHTLLMQGIRVHIKVSGHSMAPLLVSEKTIELGPINQPKRGDIIFFNDEQRGPLAHRLIRRRYYKGALYLQTKGDACTNFDNFISIEQALGTVRRIFPSSSTCSQTVNLRSPPMRINAFCIVALALFRYYRSKTKSFLINYKKK